MRKYRLTKARKKHLKQIVVYGACAGLFIYVIGLAWQTFLYGPLW
jgi:asparagine N-glycosylation enzyme membrane subunit Stt3